MNAALLVPATIVIPLIAAALSLLIRRVAVQRAVASGVVATLVAVSIALLVRVSDGTHLVVDVGGWPAPFGITLVVDTFAAMLLTISSLVLLAVFLYALSQGLPPDRESIFTTTYLMLAVGVNLAYVTGDLFNLFVAVEITLAASYVLISLWTDARGVRNAMTYIVINLVASTLLIILVAIVYAATGTVNLAELSLRLDDVSPEFESAMRLLFLLVFGIKAGLFPLFFWLPDAYPTALTPVTAIFAGLLTKVGVYAIVRTQTLLFPSDTPSNTLLVVAGLTMVVGVLGALAQNDIKRILSFHIVSQVGYMIMGVALFTVTGIAGTIFYMVHHIPVKTGLFLVGGLLEQRTGTSAIDRLGGMRRRAPVVAALFAVPALSIAGIPPFSGFVAKLGVVRAGIDADQHVIVVVSLAVSLLTLMSMLKIWTGVFWGEPAVTEAATEVATEAASAGESTGDADPGAPKLMTMSTGAVVLIVLAVGVAAGPIWDLATTAAEDLSDRSTYVQAVLGR
ncbi:MAG: Na+/H+ antiporter subunit D [Ilumatobacteraceae bacterium]